MCSKNNRSTFSNEMNKPSNYYYNPRHNNNNTNSNSSDSKAPEQTYYAKLIKVNQQQQQPQQVTASNRTSLQRRHCIRNTSTAYPSTRRLTDNYLNAKLAEYLNEADYEALINFDSVLENVTVPMPTKINSPASPAYSSLSKTTDDNLNYSNEDDDFQRYYELEKFHSNLKKNIQKQHVPVDMLKLGKSSQFNVAATVKRLDSASVGSFSSSSASSISSQSSTTNSSTSSSSSSPLPTDNSHPIYSTNFKTRQNNANAPSPIPAPPLSQPPSLVGLSDPDIKLTKSHSAQLPKMSAWLHPTADTDPTLTENVYDDCPDTCVYSELIDSSPVKPQASTQPKRDVVILKKSAQSTGRLLQPITKPYDSSLLTPLKPKHLAYSTRTMRSPQRSNSTANIKSASTSYLLSKITSIGAHRNQVAQSPPQQQQNPLTNLATKTTKFFQSRKSLTNQQQYDEISTCSNSTSSVSSPTQYTEKSQFDKLACSSSASSSISTTSSRRAFIKKRSQSSHLTSNKSQWTYNKQLDVWILSNTEQQVAPGKNDFISSTLRIKRKSNMLKSKQVEPQVCTMNSSSTVRLSNIDLKWLTQIELKYLKQICFNKLKTQLTNLSTIPKDESLKCTKTKNIALRSKSVDFKFFDEFKENLFSKKSSTNVQQVFGNSLYKCILNDLQRLPHVSSVNTAKKIRPSNVLIASKFDMNVLSNKQQSNKDDVTSSSKRNSVLFEALDLKNVKALGQSPLITGTPLLGGHKPRLSSSRNRLPSIVSSPVSSENSEPALNRNLSIRSEGLVPNIVKSCCEHIKEHGLDLVGIFRIDSSKKRIKEIKEMFDSGKEVVLNEHFNPNDSACILKEYLRSLPEPLLTRELYSSFLAANKIQDNDLKLEAIRHLICLLPVPNRDTFQTLLSLLDKVRANATIPATTEAESTKSSTSTDYVGNKMDSFNLAMVFGPNLLKKHSGNGQLSSRGISNGKLADYTNDKYNLIEDIDSVISVTKYLIENQSHIFHIESPLHNELIETINKLNPSEVLSILDRKKLSSFGLTILSQSSSSPINLRTESSTPTPSEHSSLASSPHSLHISSNNTSCSSSSSNTGLTSQSSTPEHRQNKQAFLSYLNAEFIDHQTGRNQHKHSRTKLHKIVDNFNYLNCADNIKQETINFINSPTHSPINKPTKKSTIRQLKKNDEPKRSPSSSLLMVMKQNDQNTQPQHQFVEKTVKKSAKSMSNLAQIPQMYRTGQEETTLNTHRRLSSTTSKESQYKLSPSTTTTQICSKFYEKSKYNIIGEQETLV